MVAYTAEALDRCICSIDSSIRYPRHTCLGRGQLSFVGRCVGNITTWRKGSRQDWRLNQLQSYLLTLWYWNEILNLSPTYWLFNDFRKAFDALPRNKLYTILIVIRTFCNAPFVWLCEAIRRCGWSFLVVTQPSTNHQRCVSVCVRVCVTVLYCIASHLLEQGHARMNMYRGLCKLWGGGWRFYQLS